MAFLSKLFGVQVNKAAMLAAHPGIGSMLTFDSSANFPSILDLEEEKLEVGKLFAGKEYKEGIPEYFDYLDTSTRNTYIDGSTNIMYRWKRYTKDQWGESHWEYDEERKKYIEPKEEDAPKREDYPTDDEYKEALDDWNSMLYPKYNAKGERVYEYNVAEDEKTTGWVYVPCAGGGSGDLYWSKI